MDTDALELIVALGVVVIPSVGLTARFVLKPLVDALVRLKEGGVIAAAGPSPELGIVREQMRQMREDMLLLHAAMMEMRDANDFDRALKRDAAAPPAVLTPGDG
jgi:hypothetical protein